jgi:hypothetical protein
LEERNSESEIENVVVVGETLDLQQGEWYKMSVKLSLKNTMVAGYGNCMIQVVTLLS